MELTSYTVEQMPGGRWAVVHGTGAKALTVGVVHSEDAALTAAAALNGGPVRSVNAGRWRSEARNAECGVRNDEVAA